MQITNKIVPPNLQPLNKEMHCTKVTVMENLTFPPRSDMEVMAHFHSEEEGTWLPEGTIFKKLSICVARILTVLRNQSASIRSINLDTVPVTLYKNIKTSRLSLLN